jgi:serine/threonine protein phosphatase PrpC
MSPGHGGALVADFLSKRFHIELGAHKCITTDPQRALTETWQGMDNLVLAELTQIKNAKSKSAPELMDGSTCTVCLIVGDEVFVTNCGDSSAYTFTPPQTTNGQTNAQTQATTPSNKVGTNVQQAPPQRLVPRLLTEIHGTETASEVQRILAAGGTLVEQIHANSPMFPALDAVLRKYICPCL